MRTRYVISLLSVYLLSLVFATTGWAHAGRRFEVKTESVGSLEKLYALGYSSGGVDDGGGVTRSYSNAIHDQRTNSTKALRAARRLCRLRRRSAAGRAPRRKAAARPRRVQKRRLHARRRGPLGRCFGTVRRGVSDRRRARSVGAPRAASPSFAGVRQVF